LFLAPETSVLFVELGRKEEEAENKVCRITEGNHLVVWLSDTTEVLTAALLACLAQCLEPEEAHYLAQETGGPSWQVRGKNIVYQDKVDMTPQKPKQCWPKKPGTSPSGSFLSSYTSLTQNAFLSRNRPVENCPDPSPGSQNHKSNGGTHPRRHCLIHSSSS
jgi:hypothetical protein